MKLRYQISLALSSPQTVAYITKDGIGDWIQDYLKHMVDVERLHIYESDKHPGVYRVMQAGPARDGGVVNKVSFMRTILYLVAETSELFNIVQYQAILDANTDWGPKGRSSPAWITRGGHSSDLQVFRARILQEI